GGVAIPPHLRENPSATVGSAFVVAVDAFNTLGLFAEANYHLVVGRLGGRDFWEVVPKHLFNGAEQLLDHVSSTNSSSLSGSPLVYNVVVSGEALTIIPA